MGTLGATGHGPVKAHDLNAEGETHLTKAKDHDPKRREGEHRSSKDRKRRDPSSSSHEQGTEGCVEDRNVSNPSQTVQAKAAEPQQMNPPPLPPPATTRTTEPSGSGSASAPAAQQTSAQTTQRQVAQAMPATIQTAPAIGAAVPTRQSQGMTNCRSHCLCHFIHLSNNCLPLRLDHKRN